MADPISVAASIVALVGAGYQVSKGLKEIVDSWRDAPMELSYIATNIRHMTACLGSACTLIEQHSELYREHLLSMLKDVHWQFKIIQDTIGRCIKGKKWMLKLKWLLEKRRVDSLMAKLEALKSSIGLILQVAQLAERQVSESHFKSHSITDLRDRAIDTIDSAKGQVKALQSQDRQLLIEDGTHKELVKYEEKPIEMAQWMAVTLSASLGTRVITEGRSGALQPRSRTPALNPVKRPKLLEGSSTFKYIFNAEEVNVDTLEQHGMKYHVHTAEVVDEDNITTIEVVKPGIRRQSERFEPYELEMITTLSAVRKSIPDRGWSIAQSPFMNLPPRTILDHLLQQWTTLDEAQVHDILVGSGNANDEIGQGIENGDVSYGAGRYSDDSEDDDGGTAIRANGVRRVTIDAPSPPRVNFHDPLQTPNRSAARLTSEELRMIPGSSSRTSQSMYSGATEEVPRSSFPMHMRTETRATMSHARAPPIRRESAYFEYEASEEDDDNDLDDEEEEDEDEDEDEEEGGFLGDGTRQAPFTRPWTPFVTIPPRDIRRPTPGQGQPPQHPQTPPFGSGPTGFGRSPHQMPPVNGTHQPHNPFNQYNPQLHHLPPFPSNQPHPAPYGPIPLHPPPAFQNHYTWGPPPPPPTDPGVQEDDSSHNARAELADLKEQFETCKKQLERKEAESKAQQLAAEASKAMDELKREIALERAARLTRNEVAAAVEQAREAWSREAREELERRGREREAEERRVGTIIEEARMGDLKALKARGEECAKLRRELLKAREEIREGWEAMRSAVEAETRAAVCAEEARRGAERREMRLEVEREMEMEAVERARRAEEVVGIVEVARKAAVEEWEGRRKMEREQADLVEEIKRLAVEAYRGEERDIWMGRGVAYQVFDDDGDDDLVVMGRQSVEDRGEYQTSCGDDAAEEVSDDDEDENGSVGQRGASLSETRRHEGLDIPCSRPWKGPSGVVPFSLRAVDDFHVRPLYVRGNDQGQTWFCGEDVVFVNELQSGYEVQDGIYTTTHRHSQSVGSIHAMSPVSPYSTASTKVAPTSYLQVGKQWVDTRALEQMGLWYREGDRGCVHLDPDLTWQDIASLCDLSALVRGMESLKSSWGPQDARGEDCSSSPLLREGESNFAPERIFSKKVGSKRESTMMSEPQPLKGAIEQTVHLVADVQGGEVTAVA